MAISKTQLDELLARKMITQATYDKLTSGLEPEPKPSVPEDNPSFVQKVASAVVNNTPLKHLADYFEQKDQQMTNESDGGIELGTPEIDQPTYSYDPFEGVEDRNYWSKQNPTKLLQTRWGNQQPGMKATDRNATFPAVGPRDNPQSPKWDVAKLVALSKMFRKV
jgi:hypothetical protein